MKKVLPLLICLLGIISVQAQRDRDMVLFKGKGKRVALVVGNSAYGSDADLSGIPRNDARSMKKALEKLNFSVTIKYDLSQRQMEEALTAFIRQLSKSDVGLFYYAGHGIEINGENYLVPIGAKIGRDAVQGKMDVKYNCINANQILERMGVAASVVDIMVLDACRNNPFDRSWRRSYGKSNGLSTMSARGTYVAFSTSPGDVAVNSAGGSNSPFTQSLVQRIDTRGESINDMFSLVKQDVSQVTDKKQMPWTHDGIAGEFFLNPGQKTTPSLPDRDGDGVPDQYDRCPDEYGTEYGCPPQPQVKDSDGDGYPDHQDNCPHQYSRTNKGCPEPQPKPQDSYWRDMVRVQGGSYQMGCTDGDSDCYDWEKPQHRVQLDGFYISKYEVTQQQWYDIMDNRPSYNENCNNCPVEMVSHDDIQTFLRKLNAKTGKTYRLPTEAEWEYAARGGNKSKGYKYSGSNNINDVAWYSKNSDDVGKQISPVGRKRANELGLYDMTGNVWEWCSDWYTRYNNISSSYNPKGASSGSRRVIRGGSWNYNAELCRVSYRHYGSPSYRNYFIGFRLAHSL